MCNVLGADSVGGAGCVTVLAPFRDAAARVGPYRERLVSLEHPYAALRVVVVEGDSVDGTAAALAQWAAQDSRVTLVHCATGKPHYGSVVHPERFAALAQVFNAGLDAVDLAWSTHMLMLPSDIEYQPDLLPRLLAHDVDMVSPLTWRRDPRGVCFYDLWALSENEQFFEPFSPQFAERRWGGKLAEMTTIGGTALIKAGLLAAGVRYTYDQVDRGFSRWARQLGFRLWLDPSLAVWHP